MSAPNTSKTSLPRTLKPSYVTCIPVFIWAYVVALLLSILGWIGSGSSEVLVLIGGLGGALLLCLGLIALVARQTLTLLEDRLELVTLKEKNIVLYQYLSEVKAVITGGGPKTISVMVLYLYHRGEGANPLRINLQSFKSRDQRLLLKLIHEGAPGARFNPLAEKVRQG